jgi:rare lipoprotein A
MALLVALTLYVTPVSGVASYYTESCGTVTASGERFDEDLMTCAMRNVPFDTHVLVVAENGNRVVCRVNDRGPFKRGRIIDLSKAAMRKLDPEAGLLKVKIYGVRSGRRL